jgi:hypothetical protein
MALALPREASRRSLVPRYLLVHVGAGAILGALAGGALPRRRVQLIHGISRRPVTFSGHRNIVPA